MPHDTRKRNVPGLLEMIDVKQFTSALSNYVLNATLQYDRSELKFNFRVSAYELALLNTGCSIEEHIIALRT